MVKRSSLKNLRAKKQRKLRNSTTAIAAHNRALGQEEIIHQQLEEEVPQRPMSPYIPAWMEATDEKVCPFWTSFEMFSS